MAVTLIQTLSVGAGGASTIDFTGVPNTFTDLYIVCSLRTSDGYPDTGVLVKLNGSTTSYSRRTLYGTGSAAASSTGSDIAFFSPASTATANTFGNTSIYIPNYAGATNKSVSIDNVNENNAGYSLMGITAGLWSSTAAVTSVTLTSATASTLLQGSTASLYGVKKDNILPAPKATGGTISFSGGYWYHTFTASGTFTPTTSLTADVLVVAGGGGAGPSTDSGPGVPGGGTGGGAGGLTGASSFAIAASPYTVTVGSGGTGASGSTTSGWTNGSNSVFSTLTAIGGGKGGGGNSGTTAGSSGGSGGGGHANSGAGTSGGAGTAGQGYAGGNHTAETAGPGGGGGGAGAVGGASIVGGNGGSGGVGLSTYSAWGLATNTGHNVSGTVYYAGGGTGGGGGSIFNNPGGNGGGGKGSYSSGGSGLANTGGGGGGAGSGAAGGAGASGIVIVRYLG